jgi:hypothetical protein
LDEKTGNDGRKRLDVLVPLGACELDAKRSDKETARFAAVRREETYLFDI